jgi:hypothetical protein
MIVLWMMFSQSSILHPFSQWYTIPQMVWLWLDISPVISRRLWDSAFRLRQICLRLQKRTQQVSATRVQSSTLRHSNGLRPTMETIIAQPFSLVPLFLHIPPCGLLVSVCLPKYFPSMFSQLTDYSIFPWPLRRPQCSRWEYGICKD